MRKVCEARVRLSRIFISTIRPKHFVKSLVLLMPLADSRRFFDPYAMFVICAGMMLFYMISVSMYIINDVKDLDQDRLDPVKRSRPIAAGDLPVGVALLIAIALAVSVLVISFLWNTRFAWVVVLYILLTVSYSLRLKHIAVIDVIATSCGSVLRAMGGYVLLAKGWSLDLLVLVFFATLLFGLNRRAYEMRLGGETALSARLVLSLYSRAFLDSIVPAIGGVYLVLYTSYTLNNPHTPLLVLTVPLMSYFVLRYLNFYAQRSSLEKDAQFLFLTDRWILAVAVSWMLLTILLTNPIW